MECKVTFLGLDWPPQLTTLDLCSVVTAQEQLLLITSSWMTWWKQTQESFW